MNVLLLKVLLKVDLNLFYSPKSALKLDTIFALLAQANLWIAIFSFIGNYFWTHYFYSLLGARYTFPSWRLNDVRLRENVFEFCVSAHVDHD